MSYLCRDFTWSSLHVASRSGSELMICLGVSYMGSIEHWTRWNLSFRDSPRRIFACLLRGSYCICVPFPSISFAFKSSLSILVAKQWNNSYYDSYVLTLFIASRIYWSFFLTELSRVPPLHLELLIFAICFLSIKTCIVWVIRSLLLWLHAMLCIVNQHHTWFTTARKAVRQGALFMNEL